MVLWRTAYVSGMSQGDVNVMNGMIATKYMESGTTDPAWSTKEGPV